MYKKLFLFLLISNALSMLYAQPSYQHLPCCRYEGGQWQVAGRPRDWWDQYYPGTWNRFGIRTEWNGNVSFPDISEQPDISGFERDVYNSPK